MQLRLYRESIELFQHSVVKCVAELNTSSDDSVPLLSSIYNRFYLSIVNILFKKCHHSEPRTTRPFSNNVTVTASVHNIMKLVEFRAVNISFIPTHKMHKLIIFHHSIYYIILYSPSRQPRTCYLRNA